MTGARFLCCDEGRRAALLALPSPAKYSGIDYVEVHAGATVADPTTIVVTLVREMPDNVSKLGVANFRLTGGTRFPAPALSPTIAYDPGSAPNLIASYTLTIPGGSQFDYSLYRLALVSGPGSDAPPGFIDPRLSAVDLDFKLACARDVDCAPDCDDDADLPLEDATFDYRTRDWPAFRQAMLDRLAALVPGFRGDDPLDLTVTLVEMLAAEADRLSYRLDWIGTEAFLPTARSRTSVARHARLVGYRPGEGVSARCFVGFDFAAGVVADGMVLAQSTPLLLRRDGVDPVVAASGWPGMIPNEPMVFETIADLRLWEWRSAIAFHTWSDDSCRLPKGSTSATLVVSDSPSADADLKPGDLLLLREIRSPDNGEKADASPAHRHVVRLTGVAPVADPLAPVGTKLVDVGWDIADALPFDLVIQARADGETSAAATTLCADAAANVTVADHGMSMPPAAALGLAPSATEALRPRLDPDAPGGEGAWRPVLDRADVARAQPLRQDRALPPGVPASQLLDADAAGVLPALGILDAFSSWKARPDLLASDPFDRGFVVEAGIDGRAELRFGDGIHGLAPAPGSSFAVQGRFGSGLAGNIGSDSLGHIVLPDAQAKAKLRVTNPLPARSGADPEPIASVRLNAPYAFRCQDRAVTPEDYVAAAKRHPEVSAALAIPRWTGAFQTMLVYVDRKGGLPTDRAFLATIATHLEHYRLMGIDVAVRAAVPVPLDVELFVCAAPGALRGMVGARVRDALHPRRADGGAGFFDPDRFTFGEPLRLSALIAAVMAVEGVQSVEVTTFQRFGRQAAGELAAGVIHAFGAEVLELPDDPNFPERGRLRIKVGGGR
ncbi:putative baseplate assembly protein [Sphingomonas sp.]|uniref:putative baseplate assembly protein n=1 Tax=Sphingomonas sp. TaxID=28214 RepID=UPI001B203464|nr:putative baseplate assembly protein [Sphingomonas sp.]MBO9713893.1 putative baseplate assembly protein [Sphingomonas sp.]